MNRRMILKLTGLSLLSGLLEACSHAGGADQTAAQPAAQTSVDSPEKPSAQSPTTETAMATTSISTVSVKVINNKGELVGPVSTAKVIKSDAEWKQQLTPEQFAIARAKGTERAFCGNLLDNHKDGIYVCICCNLPLFSSQNKFESGTGWPSFFQPVAKENVVEHVDASYGMRRTEILCAV